MYEVKYIREYDPCARCQKKEINTNSTQRLQTLSKVVRLNSPIFKLFDSTVSDRYLATERLVLKNKYI